MVFVKDMVYLFGVIQKILYIIWLHMNDVTLDISITIYFLMTYISYLL